ncbi:hypothetical protein BJ508DRAFT_358684 [Ascobolus immersus RN42]|uniref:Uncharacterized protein n=1 Tax=Ascobolus immersus RN42 TaxID=1160509 RepID=A0A3N4ILZ9_ASCIM|nr:hypothetical protein BJ508DRAFT_358684 [Ascobolus immersus RN42]
MAGRSSTGRGFEGSMGSMERDSRYNPASSSPPKPNKKNVMKRILGGQKPQITVPPQNIFAAWPPTALSEAELRVLASTQSPTIRQSQVEISPLDGAFLYRSSTSPPSTVSPPSTINGMSPEMRARQNFGFWSEPTPLNMQALNYPVSAGFSHNQRSPATTFGQMGVEARPPTPPRKDNRWMDKVLPTRAKRAVSNPILPVGFQHPTPPRPTLTPFQSVSETRMEKPIRVMTAPNYSGAKLARPMSTLIEQDAISAISPTTMEEPKVMPPAEKKVIVRPKNLQPPITGPEWLSREYELNKRSGIPSTPRTPRTPRTPSKGKVRARTKSGRSLSVRRNVRGAKPGSRVGKGTESRKSSTDSSASVEHPADVDEEWVTEEAKEVHTKRSKARSVRRRKGLALTEDLIEEYLTRALPPTPLDLARERKPSFQAGTGARISPREILRARAVNANLTVKVPNNNSELLNVKRAQPSPYGRTPGTTKTIVEDFRMDTITVDDRDDILKWLDSFRFAQKKARQQELALERANTRMGIRRRPSAVARKASIVSTGNERKQSINRMPSISSGRRPSVASARKQSVGSMSSLSRKGSIMKSRKSSTSRRRSPPSFDASSALPAIAYRKPEVAARAYVPPKTPMAVELPGDETFIHKLNTNVSSFLEVDDDSDSPMFCPGQDISLLSPPPTVGLHFLTLPIEEETNEAIKEEVHEKAHEEAPDQVDDIASPLDTRGLMAPTTARASRLSIASSMGNPFYYDDIMNTIKSNRERNTSIASDPFMFDRASFLNPPPPYDDTEFLTTPQEASGGSLFSPIDGHVDLEQVFRHSNIIFDHNPPSDSESDETEVEMLSDAVYSPPSSRNSPAVNSPASSSGYAQAESQYRSMWPDATKSEPASSPSCITDSSSPRAIKIDTSVSNHRYSDNSWEYRSDGGTLMSVDLLHDEIKFMLSDDVLLPPAMPAAEADPESPMKTPARRVFRRNMKFVAGRNSELPGEILFCIKDEDCF